MAAGRKSEITIWLPKREELPRIGTFFLDDFAKICFSGPDTREGMKEGGREQGKKGKKGKKDSTKSRNTIINQTIKSPSARLKSNLYSLAKVPPSDLILLYCWSVWAIQYLLVLQRRCRGN